MDLVRYAITCLDLGGFECEFVATGRTPIDVKRAVWAHFRDRHGDVWLTAGMRAELEQQMDGLLESQLVSDRPRWRRYRQ
jgi:predicted small metal-binding protein